MVFANSEHKDHFFSSRIYSGYESCRKYALSILGHEQDAEDAVQNAMMRAWVSLENLKQPDSARSWLFSIVKNCAFEIFEKNSRLAMENDPESIFPLLQSHENVEKTLILKEEMSAVSENMERLKERYRRILVLSCLMEMKPGEVCRAMNINEKTRSVLLCRARKQLKKMREAV